MSTTDIAAIEIINTALCSRELLFKILNLNINVRVTEI